VSTPTAGGAEQCSAGPPAPFHLEVRRAHPRAQLRVSGELDIATAAQLDDALAALLGDGHRYLRLDLSELTFMDVSGLRVLLRVHRALAAGRGLLILAGPGRAVRLLLRASGTDQVLLVDDASVPDGDVI
jgi:anti-sigma B factor antagonist